jgi:hypothetical protein
MMNKAHLQKNAHRRVSPKSDDSSSQCSSQIFLVVFGGDVRRTEGVRTNPSPVSPEGEKLRPSSTQALTWKTISISKRTSPLPFREGRGERTHTPITDSSLPRLDLTLSTTKNSEISSEFVFYPANGET